MRNKLIKTKWEEFVKTFFEEFFSLVVSKEQTEKALNRFHEHANKLAKNKIKTEKPDLRRSHSIYMWGAGIGVAASLIIAFVISLTNTSNSQLGNPVNQIAWIEYAECDSMRHIVLPDSSIVQMNIGTTLRYKSDFLTQREVFMSGEAVYDVTHQKNHAPFIVHCSGIDVQVKGTYFNVRGYENAEKCATTLYRGVIDIFINNTNEIIPLKPHQQLVIERKSNDYAIRSCDSDGPSWIDGKTRFTARPLSEILDFLASKYCLKVVYGSSNLSKIPFTGSFSNDIDLDSSLEMISFATGLRLQKRNKTIHIYKQDKLN